MSNVETSTVVIKCYLFTTEESQRCDPSVNSDRKIQQRYRLQEAIVQSKHHSINNYDQW